MIILLLSIDMLLCMSAVRYYKRSITNPEVINLVGFTLRGSQHE